jgi:hypothetical protein
MKKPVEPQPARRDDFAQSALRALRRAARRARVVARMPSAARTGAMRSGKLPRDKRATAPQRRKCARAAQGPAGAVPGGDSEALPPLVRLPGGPLSMAWIARAIGRRRAE